jgi:hypothetical protein
MNLDLEDLGIEGNLDLSPKREFRHLYKVYGSGLDTLKGCLEIIESEFRAEGGVPETKTYKLVLARYFYLRNQFLREGCDVGESDKRLEDIMNGDYGPGVRPSSVFKGRDNLESASRSYFTYPLRETKVSKVRLKK